jgi:hypothetical protein
VFRHQLQLVRTIRERDNVDPFWAITKHADIIAIGKQPELFLHVPRLAVFTRDLPPPPEGASQHLLNMDPPDHGRYRRVTSGWFRPRVVRGMDAKVERVTREVVDAAAEKEEGDFVRDTRRGSPSQSSPRCSGCRVRTGTISSPGRTRSSPRRTRSSSMGPRRSRRRSARGWSCSPTSTTGPPGAAPSPSTTSSASSPTARSMASRCLPSSCCPTIFFWWPRATRPSATP